MTCKDTIIEKAENFNASKKESVSILRSHLDHPENVDSSMHMNFYQNNHQSENIAKLINSPASHPDWEVSIDHSPSHIASYKNFIFVCNSYGNLCILDGSCGGQKISSQNLKITKICSISVNSKYFGVTFSNIKDPKKYYKTLPSCGIGLFSYEDKRVSNYLENYIKPIRGGYKDPRGLVLAEEFLYVSDNQLKKIFKLNYNGDKLETFSFDGGIFDISLNSSLLAAINYVSHEIYLINALRMTVIQKTKVHQENQYEHGPYYIALSNETNNNMIFFSDTNRKKIYLFDRKNPIPSFSAKFDKILSIALFDDPNQSLIVGSEDNNNSLSKNKYKLSCFKQKTEPKIYN